jgi:hypothetical protein
LNDEQFQQLRILSAVAGVGMSEAIRKLLAEFYDSLSADMIQKAKRKMSP